MSSKIKKREISIIEVNEEEERTILLCPRCIEYGFKVPLRRKILMKGEKPAADYENSCQCLACGKIFGRHEVKVDVILTDTIELVDNPHDIGRNIVGLGKKVRKNSC